MGSSGKDPIIIAEVKCRDRGHGMWARGSSTTVKARRNSRNYECKIAVYTLQNRATLTRLMSSQGVNCHNCGKRGHYSSVYFSKPANPGKTDAITANQDSLTLDTTFLGAVTSQKQESLCTIELQLEGQRLTFKLDTGTEVTAISEESLKKMGSVVVQVFQVIIWPNFLSTRRGGSD